MNPEIKTKWLTALRSGEYAQGQNCLRNANQYCCLGVLCDLAVEAGIVGAWTTNPNTGNLGIPYRNNYGLALVETGKLTKAVQEWAGLSQGNPDIILNKENVAFSDKVMLSTGEIRRRTHLAGLNDGGVSFESIADFIEEQL